MNWAMNTINKLNAHYNFNDLYKEPPPPHMLSERWSAEHDSAILRKTREIVWPMKLEILLPALGSFNSCYLLTLILRARARFLDERTQK